MKSSQNHHFLKFNILMLSILGFSAIAEPLPPLETQVEKLIQDKLPNTSIGILVQEAKTGKTLYERRIDEAFPPASTTKLFTAGAALLNLKSNYQYKTVIGISPGTLKDGILKGNLYIQFSGDPSLTTVDLTQLIKDLKSSNLTRIQGDIIIDASRFSGAVYGLGWGQDSLSWYFSPPISSVILNENKAKIALNSDKPLGRKVDIAFAADEPLKFALEQDLTIVTEEDAKDKCQSQLDMNSENALSIKGCWPQNKTPIFLQVAIKNPTLLAEKIISDSLKSENIRLDGKIEVKWSDQDSAPTVPKDLTILASHSSKPLKEFLGPLLLDSNNLYAESITKTLGYEKYKIGTFQMGVEAIKQILAKPTGIDFSKLKLIDGSGLSRYNLITPRQFGQLLFALYNDKTISGDLMQSLPVSGETGRLKNRDLKEIKGKVRAKTGSMLGVSTLAGYLNLPSGKDLIFVIMIDHLLERDKVRDFENGLCNLFLQSEQKGLQ